MKQRQPRVNSREVVTQRVQESKYPKDLKQEAQSILRALNDEVISRASTNNAIFYYVIHIAHLKLQKILNIEDVCGACKVHVKQSNRLIKQLNTLRLRYKDKTSALVHLPPTTARDIIPELCKSLPEVASEYVPKIQALHDSFLQADPSLGMLRPQVLAASTIQVAIESTCLAVKEDELYKTLRVAKSSNVIRRLRVLQKPDDLS